ncbi:conserved hypothetical protein [Chloroherpeton thalassium ATCC 35110]|uniref:DUF3793 domain-containing protein n=1 Tax=Chloroherpeton thalassium (strain ATCC 35110 / GB-78) TaxID=517418 RepID=B3QXC8_CHLT3|nr:DUF3793 family protein [Chloroherpeton thalassium]ACF13402.1 conserved hypothetical protein [Chloroherpeton thalassium ATCC 35110]
MIKETNTADKLKRWKDCLSHTAEVQANFEKWLFEQTARVLFGDKSGELLKLDRNGFDLSLVQMVDYTKALCAIWNVEMMILNCKGNTCKLIVYNQTQVDRRLRKASRKKLNAQLGYPVGMTSKSFLAEVSRRWELTGKIPHEIGIALGYPLKDVWGFMGLTSQKCSGCCGWQVFGDPRPSMKLHTKFENARRKAAFFLHAA